MSSPEFSPHRAGAVKNEFTRVFTSSCRHHEGRGRARGHSTVLTSAGCSLVYACLQRSSGRHDGSALSPAPAGCSRRNLRERPGGEPSVSELRTLPQSSRAYPQRAGRPTREMRGEVSPSTRGGPHPSAGPAAPRPATPASGCARIHASTCRGAWARVTVAQSRHLALQTCYEHHRVSMDITRGLNVQRSTHLRLVPLQPSHGRVCH